MEEIWKDIKGYEGKYQVSNLGNVKSLNYNRTKKNIYWVYTQVEDICVLCYLKIVYVKSFQFIGQQLKLLSKIQIIYRK